jgi:hypothetical protein
MALSAALFTEHSSITGQAANDRYRDAISATANPTFAR